MSRLSIFSFDSDSAKKTDKNKDIQIPLLDQFQKKQLSNTALIKQYKKINSKQMNNRLNKSFFTKICLFLDSSVGHISHESILLLIWNLLNLIGILFNFISIPITIFILELADVKLSDEQNNLFLLIDIYIIVVFIVDLIVIRWRILYYSRGRKQIRHYKLLKNYYKKGIIFDMIPLLVYISEVIIGSKFIYIKLIFYLKVYTFMQISKVVQQKLLFNSFLYAIYKFIKLVSFIFFINNLCACIYFAIDYSYYAQKSFFFQNNFLWLTGSFTTNFLNVLETFNWIIWYEYALYWAVQTTSGVGYGSMTPRNSAQVLLCNLTILTTIAMFSYFAGSIINLIQYLQEKDTYRQQVLTQLNIYSSLNQIETNKRQSINFYVQNYIRITQDKQYRQIISLFNQKMSQQFKLIFQGLFLYNMQSLRMILKNNQKWSQCALQIVNEIKIIYYSTGDIINQLNQTNELKLYYIGRGKVTLFSSYSDYYKDYRQWQYFGQRQFFFGGRKMHKVICRNFTKLFYIQKDVFFSILHKHKHQLQKIMQQIDSVLLNRKEGQKFSLYCSLCDLPHLQIYCPINNLWRDKLPIFKDNNEQIEHERNKIKRHNYKSKRQLWKTQIIVLNIDKVRQSKNYFSCHNLPQDIARNI